MLPFLVQSPRFMAFVNLWGQLADITYLTQSARAHTISTIWQELNASAFYGHGALSLSWNTGFHRFYGTNFFLADVGYAGMLFRYGLFFSIILLASSLIAAWLAHRNMKRCKLKKAIGVGLVTVILLPAGLFLYAGLMFGVLLAIAAGNAKRSHPKVIQG